MGDPQATLNSYITSYNTRIQQIAFDPADNVFLGPDFYSGFVNEWPRYYNPDGLHPNDAGYGFMATEWGNFVQ